MRWEDESYVRWYRRNTPEWCLLEWQARGLFGLIMREVDRAGILELGKVGLKAVAVAVRAPWEEIEPFLKKLIGDGCVEIREDLRVLVIPNFIAAQEANASDKARQRASREKARDVARAMSRSVIVPSQGVTDPSQNVTNGIENGQNVTLNPPTPPHPTQSDPSVQTHPTRTAGEILSSFDLALRIYGEFFTKRYGRSFQLTSVGKNSDEAALVRIGKRAETHRDRELYLRHWFRAYLRDDEAWLIDNAHPPRHFEKRLNKYGEPKKSKPPPKPALEPEAAPITRPFVALKPLKEMPPVRKASSREELAAKAKADKERLAALERNGAR